MAFLKITIDKSKRLVNTDHIVEVQLHTGGLYFRLANGEDFSVPFSHSEAPTRTFEELSEFLEAQVFPSEFVMANLGLQNLG